MACVHPEDRLDNGGHIVGSARRLEAYDYRALFFLIACIIYAFFGSPTPSDFGWAEIAVGVLLAMAVGIERAVKEIFVLEKQRFWKSAGQAFLVYGLAFAGLNGALRGEAVGAILRDVLPFLFLFMPMFLLPVMRSRPQYFLSAVAGVVIVGWVFALRSIVMRDPDICGVWCADELLYLENMPTVLFCALFLIGYGLRFLMTGISPRNVFLLCGALILALVPLAAMIITTQRASVGGVMIYVALVFCLWGFQSPARALRVFTVAGGIFILIGFSVFGVVDDLRAKTALVGLNMRPQEFAAVWDVVRADTQSFLFGVGWGGQFYSPAVGGLRVNFTHNFFSSVLLKTGFCGLLLASLYVLGLLERLMRVILRDPVFGLALAAPIFIDLTLYASFKSLDFGLVLLLISGALVYSRQSESLERFNRIAEVSHAQT